MMVLLALFAAVAYSACPVDKPEFACLIAPCQARNESCPTGTFCVNDCKKNSDCGGCNSICQPQKFEDVEPFLRCLAIGTCAECAKDSGCVWCDRPMFRTGFCSSGKDNAGSECAYQFETYAVNDAARCPAAVACPMHNNCTSCIADEVCAWCGASKSCVAVDSPLACIDKSTNSSVVTPPFKNATQCAVFDAQENELNCNQAKSCSACLQQREEGKPCLWCSPFLSQNSTCTAGVGAKGEKCPNVDDRVRTTCTQCPDATPETCKTASALSTHSIAGITVSIVIALSFFAI